MEAAKKTSMVNDMEAYLASKKWYGDRGIPWRRGYLFYGPPGSGKTSIASALAGHFGIELHVITLSAKGMDDIVLQNIFELLPTKCVVLLEDIDSAGIGRQSTPEPTLDKGDKSLEQTSSVPFRRNPVSLSGLINAIDGPCSPEGHILICTSNSPDALDPALVRPGRIDMKILFGYASAEVSESLFLHVFEDPSGKTTEVDLAESAQKFATLIPEHRLSPAEVQSYLLLHRHDPVEALKGAAAWAKDLLDTKSQGGNVASFKGQI
jgi:chaperone BCS1